MIQILSKNWAKMSSFSKPDKTYQVKFTPPYSCTCENFRREVIEKKKKDTCKHLNFILEKISLDNVMEYQA